MERSFIDMAQKTLFSNLLRDSVIKRRDTRMGLCEHVQSKNTYF